MDRREARYAALCAKVDAFAAAARRLHPQGLTCHAGCDSCCRRQFSVWRLEAAAMRRAFQALPAARQALVRGRALANERQPPPLTAPCLFLDEGRCLIYEARPIICRSQGLPLRSREIVAPRHLDWCPLNFKGFAPADFDPAAVLNLDTVNRLLAGLVREEEAERGGATGSPGLRLTMTDIVLRPELCDPLP